MSHQVLWNDLNAASIRALYAKLYPSPDKVMELLQPNGDYVPLTARRERVFEFLRRYVRGLSRDKVPVFLQFVTGSSLVLVPRIEVAFTTLSGIQRRHIATHVLAEYTCLLSTNPLPHFAKNSIRYLKRRVFSVQCHLKVVHGLLYKVKIKQII